jgi:ribosomal protein L16
VVPITSNQSTAMFSFCSARPSFSAYRLSSPTLSRTQQSPNGLQLSPAFARFRSQLAPKRVDNIKRHKGVIPVPIGGSTKGTTLAFGEWGIRIKGNGVRLTAKQLTSAEEAVKRKIKSIKGAKVYMRVFPDIPVCLKVRSVTRFSMDNKQVLLTSTTGKRDSYG